MLFEEIVEQFNDAFAGVVLGEGMSLRDAQVTDSYGRAPYDQTNPSDNITMDWRKIPLRELERDNICHRDYEGFRYYIPAMAIALVGNYDPGSMRVIGTITSLDMRTYDQETVDGFGDILTTKQKRCLAVYLRELPTFVELDAHDKKICERGLEHYWAQFL
jgi:Family of unknown function (DUF6714)